MKVRSFACFFLLMLLLVPGVIQAQEGAKTKGKAKGGIAAASTATASALDNMAAMIPEGLRNLKVRIPGFEQGRPTSLVLADVMTRQGDKSLWAEGVVLHLYAENPKENLRVDMKSATYHLDTKILTSEERTKVSRADFQMEGDSMIFDTATSKGEMKGHVHTVIFDTSGFAPKKNEEPVVPKATPVTIPPDSAPAPESKPTTAP